MFRKRKNLFLIILVLATTLLFTACGNESTEESSNVENASQLEWSISIETLEGQTKEFTNLDMDEIGRIDLEAKLERKDGSVDENQWSGIALSEVLAYLGVEEYSGVEIEAEDGFTVEYDKDTVDSQGTILADSKDGNQLDEEDGPVQMVVDGQGAKMWIKQVAKISVTN